MAIGLSAQKFIVGQVEGIGSNLIAVLPGASDEDGPPAAAFGISITTLKYDDLLALTNKNNVPEVEAGAGYVLTTATISKDSLSQNVSVTGTTAGYVLVENAKLKNGRFFFEEEEKNLSKVTVIGSNIAEDFFGNDNPVGHKLKVNNQNYEIVGVLEERGSGGFGVSDQDSSVFLPLKTAQKILMGIDHLGFARLKVSEAWMVENAKKNTEVVLRQRHNISNPENDDFSVRDLASALETITTITDVLRYFLVVIGSISLLVGGVGIMNIMLIAVNQRIREVGLRKALGAKKSDVLWQFVIEAVTVSVIGGAIGVVLGFFVSVLVAFGMNLAGIDWEFSFSVFPILIALAVSFLIGVVFGIYPALKASEISPMEALRYE